MKADAFIARPTALATQLSALTRRAIVLKSVPKATMNGRPLMVAS